MPIPAPSRHSARRSQILAGRSSSPPGCSRRSMGYAVARAAAVRPEHRNRSATGLPTHSGASAEQPDLRPPVSHAVPHGPVPYRQLCALPPITLRDGQNRRACQVNARIAESARVRWLTDCEVGAAQILWFGAGGGPSYLRISGRSHRWHGRSSTSGRRPLCGCEAQARGALAQRRVLGVVRSNPRQRHPADARLLGRPGRCAKRYGDVTPVARRGRPPPGTIRQAHSPAAPIPCGAARPGLLAAHAAPWPGGRAPPWRYPHG